MSKIKFSLSFEQRFIKRTQDEIKALPDFSINVSEDAFKIKAKDIYVAIDNEKGIGEVPNNRNIRYLGVIALMDIDSLFNIIYDVNSQVVESAKKMEHLIKEGYSIGNPFIDLNVDSILDEDSDLKHPVIIGHEGRARSLALKHLGVKEIPVQVFLPGYRSRHIKNIEEFKDKLNEGVVKEGSKILVKNAFNKIIKG